MATASQLQDYIGKTGLVVSFKTLCIPVQILDARERFGRIDLLVTPIGKGGSGEAWIAATNVTLT